MKKSLKHRDSDVSLSHNHPGCMRGIFTQFTYHKWHNVRKMLPYKRHSGGKHIAVHGESGSSTDAVERPENADANMDKSTTEARVTESGFVHKSSKKFRLKALIPEEMSKRKGRHRRSSSQPTRLQMAQTDSPHYREFAGGRSTRQISLNDEHLRNEDKMQASVANLLDLPLPKVHQEPVNSSNTCDLCAAMLTMNYLRQSDVNEKGNQPVKDHTLLQDKSIYAIEPSKTASLQESKLFLDALDLLNMRKELFLKVLKDPNSSLSHQLHGKQLAKLRVGLTKSVSFPMPGSSRGRPVVPSDAKSKHSQYCTFALAEEMEEHSTTLAMCQADSTIEESHGLSKPIDIAYPATHHQLKSRHGNILAIKRFKNIGEKIKHAINESRKDRQRILMDAVLHKIPYGRKSTKQSKGRTDTHERMVDMCDKNVPGSGSRIGLPNYCRASSFNQSFEKYNQLIESDHRGEAKGQTSERSKLRINVTPSPVSNSSRKLERILSLPNLRSFYGVPSEVSPKDTSSNTPDRSSEHKHSESCERSDNQSEQEHSESYELSDDQFGEQKHSESCGRSDNHFSKQKHSASSGHLDNQIEADAGETNDSSSGLKLEKSASILDLNNEHKLTYASVLEKPIPDPAHDFESQDGATSLAEFTSEELVPKDSLPIEESVPKDPLPIEDDSLPDRQHELSTDSVNKSDDGIKLEKVEASLKQFGDDIFQLQVDMKNKSEFNYVKDVLELSGFSRHEFLGKWHSAGQPLDPSFFHEVEESLLAQPDDFYENEVYRSCDNLFLFELINEVLLDINGKSSSYWPMPLTCCSHIHPMPVGHHVLEGVWADISHYLRWRPEFDQSLDDAVGRDLARNDGWMNLQFDAECVGLELEQIILDDLLDEVLDDLS